MTVFDPCLEKLWYFLGPCPPATPCEVGVATLEVALYCRWSFWVVAWLWVETPNRTCFHSPAPGPLSGRLPVCVGRYPQAGMDSSLAASVNSNVWQRFGRKPEGRKSAPGGVCLLIRWALPNIFSYCKVFLKGNVLIFYQKEIFLNCLSCKSVL